MTRVPLFPLGSIANVPPTTASIALARAGVPIVIMDGWHAAETLNLIEQHRITHTHMVPTMFHRLLSLPDDVRERADLSSLIFVIHGAAPCPPDVKRRLIEWLGPIVWEYYAATEGAGTLVGPDEWLRKPVDDRTFQTSSFAARVWMASLRSWGGRTVVFRPWLFLTRTNLLR